VRNDLINIETGIGLDQRRKIPIKARNGRKQ
jgi:hypothetical protein